MARTCTICTHNQRHDIEQALVNGEPYRHIANRFGTSTAALQRHKAEHLPGHVAIAKEAADVADAGSLLDQLKALQQRAMRLLDAAEKAGDIRTALMGIREARGCIETLMEIEGELDRRGVMNVVIQSQWIELRAVVIEALQPFPEARLAVAAKMQEAERGLSHVTD